MFCLTFIGGLQKRNALFRWTTPTDYRWTTNVRLQSTDAFTEELDHKEAQRLKDEETIYETNIKIKILDSALSFVESSGWSKQTLAKGIK